MTEDRRAALAVFRRPPLGLVDRFAQLLGLWGEIGLSVGIACGRLWHWAGQVRYKTWRGVRWEVQNLGIVWLEWPSSWRWHSGATA